MIAGRDREILLRDCDLGYSSAEDDIDKLSVPLSRMLVPAFFGCIDDQIDHVRGARGTGKSALLFIVMRHLSSPASKHKDILCAPVVPAHANPVLWQLRKPLESLDQGELINFWSLYLIIDAARCLHEAIKADPRFREMQGQAASLYRKLDGLLRRPAVLTRVLMKLQRVLRIGIGVTPFPVGPVPTSVDIQFREAPTSQETMRLIRIARRGIEARKLIEDLKATLTEMLTYARLRVWLLFDGLDLCLPRRTDLEREAMLALLRTAYHLGSHHLRLKLFIRDDILHDLTKNGTGLTDFPKIRDRMSPPLRWSVDDILSLIVRRVFSNEYLAMYFNVDFTRLRTSPDYRAHLLSHLLPTLRDGADSVDTFRWIVRQCSTAHGEATPRDVIEFFKLARDRALYLLDDDLPATIPLLPHEALEYAFAEISDQKVEAYLNNDFPDLRDVIILFRNGPAELTGDELSRLLGDNWRVDASTLQDIGFLGYENGPPGRYFVGQVFRRSMNLS